MHTILIAGMEDRAMLHEVASANQQLHVILPESQEDFIEAWNKPLDLMILPSSIYKRYQKEIDLLIEKQHSIKFFLLLSNLTAMDFHHKDLLLKKYFPMKVKSMDRTLVDRILNFAEEMDNGCICEDLVLNYRERTISVQHEVLPLTPLEFDLFLFLRLHEKTTLTRDELIKAVWGYNFLGDSRTIDTHIKSLRRKLGKYRCLIKTIWGKGYQMDLNGISSFLSF